MKKTPKLSPKGLDDKTILNLVKLSKVVRKLKQKLDMKKGGCRGKKSGTRRLRIFPSLLPARENCPSSVLNYRKKQKPACATSPVFLTSRP